MAPCRLEEEEKPAGLGAWEERLWAEGHAVVAGTDEAGRGPLAGPVVAAAFAVIAHEDAEVRELLAAVADSKQMTTQQREDLFVKLTSPNFEGRTTWAIAEASVAEIDEANILRAALTAMSRAVSALSVPRPDVVLVDGCNRPPELLAPGEQWTRGPKKTQEDARKQPKLLKWFAPIAKPKVAGENPQATDGVATPWRPQRVEAVIEGDGRVPSISAASILAKVYRDRLMEKLHVKYPQYGFMAHKGYGTEAHMQALREHGVCPEHRRSFGPVREALGLDTEPEQRPTGNIQFLLGAARSTAGSVENTTAFPAMKVENSLGAGSAKVGRQRGRPRAKKSTAEALPVSAEPAKPSAEAVGTGRKRGRPRAQKSIVMEGSLPGAAAGGDDGVAVETEAQPRGARRKLQVKG
mmetsp:Transcript_1451/g.3892  ORF Transcript_1451/g.3892 Transcript_1451/m.3892 type:complete len:409 (-) Transcript_1451:200-1426(-)